MNMPKPGDICERLSLSTGIVLSAPAARSLRVLIDATREVRPIAAQASQDRNGLPRTVVQMAEALADCAEYRELPTLMAALALEAAGIPFNFTSVVTHG